ncbi:hypothetical protein ACLKA7_007960 [Drosophila subpalustris]
MSLDTSMISSERTLLTLTMDHGPWIMYETWALIKQPLLDVDELLIAISFRDGAHIGNTTNKLFSFTHYHYKIAMDQHLWPIMSSLLILSVTSCRHLRWKSSHTHAGTQTPKDLLNS